MIHFNEYDLNNMITTYLLCFSRVGAMIMAMPVLGTKVVPKKIKTSLAVGLSYIAFSNVNINFDDYGHISFHILLLMLLQVGIGLAIGFVMQVVFHIFIMLGEIISMQAGLGFAMMNDSTNGASVPMISQFYILIITYLFFYLDGHLALFSLTNNSFSTIPINLLKIDSTMFYNVVIFAREIIYSALHISLPVVIGLLLVNIAFGVLTKAAPQLNLFTIGFPITMILGTVFIWFIIGRISGHFIEFNESALGFIQDYIIEGNHGIK